jgi:four helix bundle protein
MIYELIGEDWDVICGQSWHVTCNAMGMRRSEMPISTRTFDFLSWLLPVTNNFPRAQRHTFTRQLLDTAFELREHIETANYRSGEERLETLNVAYESLEKVGLYLRLAMRWGWLSDGQYQHVDRMVAEIGRLLGGWQKVT